MQKPAILCVANWDSDVGYAWWLMESFWVKIAEHFKDNYTIILAYPSVTMLPESISNSALKVVEFDFTFNKAGSIFCQLKFLKSHRVMHVYLSDRPTKNWRYPLFRAAGVQSIINHDHTPGERTMPVALKRWIKRIANYIPLYNCDGVIGATEFVRKRLIEVGCIPSNRCYAAPNGIAPVSCKNDTPIDIYSRFQILGGRNVIVLVGRANLYKGAYFALKVIEALVKSSKSANFHFLYLGDGPDLEKFSEIADEMNIGDYVSFPGRVNDIAKILKACYVAFHPSKGEVGYSLSILEYMQAGLPVVVSDNPSVCGATKDGVDGFIYKQDDVSSAATRLESLLSDPAMTKSMGESASTKVRECYSLESCHHSLIHALGKIMGLPPSD